MNGASALGNLSTAQGRRLAADVNDRMVAYITQATGAGATLRDTHPVFYSGRANIQPIDTTSLDTVIEHALAARALASKRKGAGDVIIGVAPRFWIVPGEFEPIAIRAAAQIAAVEAANVNPLGGRLDVLAEPRLADPAKSYLVAPPALLDGMVRVNLTGAPGPMTESRWGFEVDAVQFKIRLDIGFAFVEWRSWTRLDHSAGG
jgi:hypothetical protein